jgi:hypothetical protein
VPPSTSLFYIESYNNARERLRLRIGRPGESDLLPLAKFSRAHIGASCGYPLLLSTRTQTWGSEPRSAQGLAKGGTIKERLCLWLFEIAMGCIVKDGFVVLYCMHFLSAGQLAFAHCTFFPSILKTRIILAKLLTFKFAAVMASTPELPSARLTLLGVSCLSQE